MVLGVLTPLVIADLTTGSGRYNLAQGFVGMVSGIGAALSTTVSGLIAQKFGITASFLEILAAALVACLGVWLLMPETKSRSHGGGGQHESRPRHGAGKRHDATPA
jgi:sugar phosphate permease